MIYFQAVLSEEDVERLIKAIRIRAAALQMLLDIGTPDLKIKDDVEKSRNLLEYLEGLYKRAYKDDTVRDSN